MFADRRRTRTIVEMIKDRKYDLIWKNTNLSSWRLDFELIKLMKESGCYQITLSPESGNTRVLTEIIHKPAQQDTVRQVVKWCKELGVEVLCDFVIGFPGANPTLDTEHWSRHDLKMLRVLEWDRINFKTPEKIARYAKANGLTLEQVEAFRKETRKNLGVYFFDQAGDRHEEDQVKLQLGKAQPTAQITDGKKWWGIKKVAAAESAQAVASKTVHEII